MCALHSMPPRPVWLRLLAQSDAAACVVWFSSSTVCPSVRAIGAHAFQSQHCTYWQTLHNAFGFYYHNWWRHPTVLMLPPNFAFSVTLWQFHACAHMAYTNCTHVCLLAALFWLSFSTFISNLNRPLTWVKTSDMYLFLFIKAHIHLPMCSVTQTWGWLPSCASCFFHQHVFTSRGPLCLHYREAINRKASPGVLKLPLLWEGRTLRRSEP